jgi:methyltransferase (TIGR00027 family)
VKDQDASRTALATAYLRAAHQLLDPEPHIFDDPMALPLLGSGARERICREPQRYGSPAALALRAHVVLRARYTEDQLALAVARGAAQYLLIGAGLDTFALRQAPWARQLRIIEVDHPSTQELKQAHLAAAGLVPPENLMFASVDFEQESLDTAIRRLGILRDVPTFFSWLGVTMYLTEAAIDTTLRCLCTFAPGSEAVITFLQPAADPASASSALAARVSEVGEPFVSTFTPERFEHTLLAAGFREVHMLTPAESDLYFTDSEGSLPKPRHISIVSARV